MRPPRVASTHNRERRKRQSSAQLSKLKKLNTVKTTMNLGRNGFLSCQLLLPFLLNSSPRALFVSSYFTSSNMATFITHRENGVITVSPKIETNQSGLVVISHGLGDSAEGFVDVAEHLATQMPHLKFILPTAPTKPVTMNMGMPMPSWYDITGLDERSNEDCKGIEESQNTIKDILKKEHEELGLTYDRMVLAGFSQGGALSLFTGMQLDQKLAGIVVMSGYLPAARKFSIKDSNKDTPILHCHGDSDPLLQVNMAKKSKEVVMEKGATNYKLKIYPGLVHSVNPQELQDVKEFIESVIPPDNECRVRLKDPSDMSVKELKAAIRKAGLGSKAVGLMEKNEFVKLVQDHRNGKL